MKYLLIIALSLLTCCIPPSNEADKVVIQEEKQDISMLEQKKGFQDIKLETSIENYKGFIQYKYERSGAYLTNIGKFANKLKDKYCKRYYYKGHEKYKSIGNVKITNLRVDTYKGKIYEIIIFCDPKTYYN